MIWLIFGSGNGAKANYTGGASHAGNSPLGRSPIQPNLRWTIVMRTYVTGHPDVLDTPTLPFFLAESLPFRVADARRRPSRVSERSL